MVPSFRKALPKLCRKHRRVNHPSKCWSKFAGSTQCRVWLYWDLRTIWCLSQGLLEGRTSMRGVWLPKLGDNALTFEASTRGVSPHRNLHCRDGLFALALMLINTKVDGLAWWSPTCASWVWMSLGTTIRHIEPWVWKVQSYYSMK